jgi:ATP-dependent DNA helicase RecG
VTDIRDIVSLPEGKTIEFKRDLSSIKPILKSLIAFANTAGGTLLLGKDNDGTIVGINDVFEAEEKLANAIADSIYPPLMPEIEITSLDGKSIILVRIAHWRGPFYLKSQGPEAGVYVRLGSTNRVAGPELLAELKRSISNTSFDQMPCPEVGIDGLDMSRIKTAFSNIGRKISQKELETLEIVVPYAGTLVCSNGGLILFGKDQLREKYFPNAKVRCARFQGVDKVNFIDQYDCEGTIVEAMKDVPNFIRRNTRLAAKIDQIQRKDIPEYALIAIREVLTNALVHADYSIKGMNPRVAIFSDRLEIENPGMLPFGYTLDEFIAGVSHIRNKVIARVFRELHLMEEWGTGYKRIIEVCEADGYKTPSWGELGTAIRVIFTPHLASQEIVEPVLSKRIKELTLRQQKILNFLRQHEPLNAKTIHKNLGEQRSERTLRSDLLELKAMGLLVMMGSGPSTLWSCRSLDLQHK